MGSLEFFVGVCGSLYISPDQKINPLQIPYPSQSNAKFPLKLQNSTQGIVCVQSGGLETTGIMECSLTCGSDRVFWYLRCNLPGKYIVIGGYILFVVFFISFTHLLNWVFNSNNQDYATLTLLPDGSYSPPVKCQLHENSRLT